MCLLVFITARRTFFKSYHAIIVDERLVEKMTCRRSKKRKEEEELSQEKEADDDSPPKKKKVEDEGSSSSGRLASSFYNVECTKLAKNLLGKIIKREVSEGILAGRIVETEAYLGGEDKASHSFKGQTERNKETLLTSLLLYAAQVSVLTNCALLCVVVRALFYCSLTKKFEKFKKEKYKIVKNFGVGYSGGLS